ncbi:MAG: hypothetical protein HOE90_01635 [Bacteriovoracaceae bacterium]|jgi:hypothetical protein|nr:hypothetical protein [Bacteriovoracaceae bacterium]
MSKKLFLINNARGTSILQATIAAAIVSGLTLTVMKISDEGNKTTTRMQASIEKANLFNRMNSLFNSSSCEETGISQIMGGQDIGEESYSLPYIILGGEVLVFDEEELPDEMKEAEPDEGWSNDYRGTEIASAIVVPEDSYAPDGSESATLVLNAKFIVGKNESFKKLEFPITLGISDDESSYLGCSSLNDIEESVCTSMDGEFNMQDGKCTNMYGDFNEVTINKISTKLIEINNLNSIVINKHGTKYRFKEVCTNITQNSSVNCKGGDSTTVKSGWKETKPQAFFHTNYNLSKSCPSNYTVKNIRHTQETRKGLFTKRWESGGCSKTSLTELKGIGKRKASAILKRTAGNLHKCRVKLIVDCESANDNCDVDKSSQKICYLSMVKDKHQKQVDRDD